MLAYLVLHDGVPVAREHLAFTIFPDLPEDDALKELRRYLYLAQKALPARAPPWIVADAESIQWNGGCDSRTDVLEFRRLRNSDATLAAAVDAYAGELLPEFYDEWVIEERERLRIAFHEALTALVVRSRGDRRYADAIRFARRLLADDPWREDILRHLIAARYESGDTAGAIAEFDKFARCAREELRVEPMPETRALRDALTSGQPLPTSLDRVERQYRNESHTLAFAGRSREIARLHHAWERAARGNGGLVVIEGESGIGKSRLAAEFALAVEHSGGRVFAGTTSSPEKMPYQCVVELLRTAVPLLDALHGDDGRAGILSELLPELRDRAPAHTHMTDVAPENGQLRLFDAVISSFASLARTRPLLLVIEDAHWAGQPTLALLRVLARRAARLPMLIVLTARDDEIPPEHPLRMLQRELSDEHLAIRLPLGRLTRADVDYLLEHLENRDGKELHGDALFDRSEGHPLFLSEAIRESYETGSQRIAGGLSRIVERRLSSLSNGARRLADTAATCGNAFDLDAVCLASHASDAETQGCIDELLDRHIVREIEGSGGFEYVFTHHLIASVLYEALDPDKRARLHARIAAALERTQLAHVDRAAPEIARHYDAGAERAKAGSWYARAARVAAGVFAHADTVRYATLALERIEEPGAVVDLLLLRERANARLGKRELQLRDLDELDRRCADELRGALLERRIALARASQDSERGREAIQSLRAYGHRTGDHHWLGIADCAEAWLEISIGAYAVARPLAESALRYLTECGSVSEQVDCLTALAEIDVAAGQSERAETLLEEARAIAERGGDEFAKTAALMQSVAIAMSQQCFDRVIRLAREAAELHRMHGDLVGEALAQANTASAAVRLSRWREAREANAIAAATFESIGDRRGLARVLMNLGMLHGRCGDFAASRGFYARALEYQTLLKDDRARTAALLNQSFIALWERKSANAKQLAMSALGLASEMQHAAFRAQALGNLGAAERDLGEIDAAIAHMDEGIALQTSVGRMPDAASDLVDAALAHALNGEDEAAKALIDRFLSLDHGASEAAVFPPYPWWIAARVLAAFGDARGAGTLAQAAKVARSSLAAIDDDELRNYFEALPFFASIRRAQHGDWGDLRHASGTAT